MVTDSESDQSVSGQALQDILSQRERQQIQQDMQRRTDAKNEEKINRDRGMDEDTRTDTWDFFP